MIFFFLRLFAIENVCVQWIVFKWNNQCADCIASNVHGCSEHVKDMVYLNYKTIRRLFKGLSAKEHEQLLDYIISRYLPIDKDTLLSFYKGYDEMVMAINSNTGSEYDIKEEYNNDSDRIYTQMLNLVEKSSFAEKPHSVIMAEERKKWQIAAILKQRTGAKDYQVARVLHTVCPKSHW